MGQGAAGAADAAGSSMADRRKREHEAEKELIKKAKDAEEAERASERAELHERVRSMAVDAAVSMGPYVAARPLRLIEENGVDPEEFESPERDIQVQRTKGIMEVFGGGQGGVSDSPTGPPEEELLNAAMDVADAAIPAIPMHSMSEVEKLLPEDDPNTRTANLEKARKVYEEMTAAQQAELLAKHPDLVKNDEEELEDVIATLPQDVVEYLAEHEDLVTGMMNDRGTVDPSKLEATVNHVQDILRQQKMQQQNHHPAHPAGVYPPGVMAGAPGMPPVVPGVMPQGVPGAPPPPVALIVRFKRKREERFSVMGPLALECLQHSGPFGIWVQVRAVGHLWTGTPRHLTTPPLHHSTTPPPHHPTTLPPHHLTTSPPHHLTTLQCVPGEDIGMVQRLLGPKSAGDIMAMKPALRVGTKRDMEIGFPKKVEVRPSERMGSLVGGLVGWWVGGLVG